MKLSERLAEIRRRQGDRTEEVAAVMVHGLGGWADLKDAAKEYRDAEWAIRILDGDGVDRLDPRWNAAVERWRAADAALAPLLDDRSPFAAPDQPA